MNFNEFQFFAHFFHTFSHIIGNSLVQLVEAQLHVVKVGNGFAQGLVEVDKLLLEMTKSQSAVIAALGSYFFKRKSISNINTHAPVTAIMPDFF